jgi:serine/threonine protein kinase
MLRKIIEVNNISAVQQNLSHNIYGLEEIQYEESLIGKGAMGTVFKIVNIDGKTETGLLVKIISEPEFLEKSLETINTLHSKLNAYQKIIGNPALIDIPELNGLPFLAFKGKLEDTHEHITGFLMRDLIYHEYNDFGSETWNREKYITEVGFEEKLYLGYQLARGVNFLHEQKFIHADLKDYSIFINLKKPQLSIIDYDGGYHYDTQKFASTMGAISSWASARWRKMIGQGKSAKDVSMNERLDEENWVLASGLFEIVFGMPPFYFLKDVNEETIDSYLETNVWPNFKEESKEINTQNIRFHSSLIRIINELSEQGLKPLIDQFIKVFNEGHGNPNKRLTPKQWKSILFEINKELVGNPRIDSFSSNTQSINQKNEKVSFNWDAHFYSAIYIDDQLQDTLINDKTITIEDSRDVGIRVINDFGESSEKIQINANKVDPIIEHFDSSIIERKDLTPVVLSWVTSNCRSVSIERLGDAFEPIGKLEVNPLQRTKYKLSAIGFFDQQVTNEIEIEVQSVEIVLFRYEINIEKGIDNIDIHWDTQNASEVEIIPRIGKVETTGSTSIGIFDKTDFTLIVKGYFNETQKVIQTQPFPIPIIKTIFIPTPLLHLETVVPENLLKIPEVLSRSFNVNFNNSIVLSNDKSPFVAFSEDQLVKIISIEKEKKSRPILSLFHNLFNHVHNK